MTIIVLQPTCGPLTYKNEVRFEFIFPLYADLIDQDQFRLTIISVFLLRTNFVKAFLMRDLLSVT